MPSDEVALIINQMNENHRDLSSQLTAIRHDLQDHGERIVKIESRCESNVCNAQPQSVWNKPVTMTGVGAAIGTAVAALINALATKAGQ